MLWKILQIRYNNRSAICFGRYVFFCSSLIVTGFVFGNSKRKLLTFDFSIHWGSNMFFFFCFFLWSGNIWIANSRPSFNSDFFHAAEKLGQRQETFRWKFLTFKMIMKRQTTKYYFGFTEVTVMLSYLK